MKQIEMMKAAVAREEEKAYELEIISKSVCLHSKYTTCACACICMCMYIFNHYGLFPHFVLLRLYSYGEYKAEDQEQMLAQLDKKVADVYTKTIGPNEANIP